MKKSTIKVVNNVTKQQTLMRASFDVLYCSPQPSLISELQILPYIQNTWVNLGNTIPKVTVKRCVQVEMLRITYYRSLWRTLSFSVILCISYDLR